MTRDCVVLVVGGGLAGLAAARGLAAAGLSVRVVDQKRWLGERVHTTGIFVRRTLEDFALPEDCLGPPIRDVVLYSPARRSIALSSPHDEYRVGRMAPLYQRMRQVAEAAGARVHTGRRLVGARPDGRGGVEVALEPAGGAAGADGGAGAGAGTGTLRALSTRFVIGADGARSRVAALLGLDRNRAFLIGAEVVLAADHSAGTSTRPCLHCFLDPELAPGYLAWVADDGHEVHVGVAGDPTRFRALAALARFRASLIGQVPGAAGRPGGRVIERRGGRIPVGGLLAHIACPRGLLVGDASGAVSPLTAGGLDPCLRQARLAIEVTRAYLGQGDRGALAAYQSPLLARRFRGRRWMRRGFDRLRGRAAIEVAFAALSVRPLAPVAERVFFGRGSFPDLDLARLRAPDARPLGSGRRRPAFPL